MRNVKGSRHAPLRDALAGLFNLETLLGSPRAASNLVLGVLPELERGMRTVGRAFDAKETAEPDAAREALAEHARSRVDAVCSAIDRVPPVIDPRARLSLLNVVMAARPDLEAAVDLLSLHELSLAQEPTELGVGEVVRVALSGEKKRPSVRVRLLRAEGALLVDARILTSVLRHAVTRLGGEAVTVGATVSSPAEGAASNVEITIERTSSPEAEGDTFVAPLRRIPPTDAVIDAVLSRIGGTLRVDDRRVTLSLVSATKA
jgi:hypothetical protein